MRKVVSEHIESDKTRPDHTRLDQTRSVSQLATLDTRLNARLRNSKRHDEYEDIGKEIGCENKLSGYNFVIIVIIIKGKAVPLQAWSGPEGCRELRFPDFVTTAQDGDKVVSLMHRPPLPPGNTPGTHFC